MSSEDRRKVQRRAEARRKKGESAAKGGFFSKPDWGEASKQFSDAAADFHDLEDFVQAKECFERAAEAYDKCMLQSKSGEFYVNGAKAAMQLSDIPEVLRLLDLAKARYMEDNQPLQAIRNMRDAAQRVRNANPVAAIDLYDALLTLVEDTESYHWEKECFIDYAVLLLEMQKYPEAVEAWGRAKMCFQKLHYDDGVAHCVVSQVAIHLMLGDIVAAEDIINREMQQDYFLRSDDFTMIDYILRGVKGRDGDLLELGQKHFVLQFLKPEVVRIICGFKAPKKTPKPEEDLGGDMEEDDDGGLL